MRLCVTTELRLEGTADGAIWTTGAMPYAFWRRYLEVFESVRVIARVRQVEQLASDWRRADGPGVEFLGLPYYVGFAEYLRRMHSVRRAARAGVSEGDALIMRVSSTIAGSLDPLLRDSRPHGLEVVGDPYEALAAGSAVRHPLRPLFQKLFTRQLRRQCQRATAVAYVTEHTLQTHYPPNPAAFSTHYSSVELPDEAFASQPKKFSDEPRRRIRLISIGSMEALYKGFDVLIDALGKCVKAGLPVDLVLVGDGRHRQEYEQYAAAVGSRNIVQFRGAVSAGQSIRDELNAADLFVLASKTEGLPRVMIEAMACGLPCVGSRVGGIPELLPASDMFPKGDSEALAYKLQEILGDPGRMSRMAERNLSKARDYQDSQVNIRRKQLLQFLRAATDEWWSKRRWRHRPERALPPFVQVG
jgi:glycosyltransferase involved in cell wall biosynthesis